MHLLFLGVVKTTTREIHSWIKSRYQSQVFMSYVSGILESLKHFNLSWLNIIGYKGEKMGGWVSENYIPLARVYKWFYSFVEHVAPDTQYVEPTTKLSMYREEKLIFAKELLGRRGDNTFYFCIY